MKNQIAEIEKLKEALKIARKAMDKASMMYFRDLEGIDKMVAEQDDLIERTLKEQQLDDLANGTLQTHFNFKVAELQAENTELRKHIEAAIDDLPHKPDSARDYLIHALKGE